MATYETKEIFAKNLTALLNENNETQAALAEILGVAASSVSGWCSGIKMPRMDKIEQIAAHYSVPRSRLLEDQSKQSALPSGASEYDLSKLHRIPVLGNIAAGLPLYADENVEGYTYTELNGGAEYFALRVTGDSMNALRINEGDIVIVRRQPEVENGEVAVVLVDGENATLKRFYQTESSITLMPQSTNPIHVPQVYDPAKTRVDVLGKVVKVEFML